MIAILKFLTILMTGLFGVFASLVDFRDTSGRITRNGWIGLAGVITAGISAGALQVYSDFVDEKSTLEILEQNDAVLNEVNRTLHPLPGLTITYFLRPDWNADGLGQYYAEFQQTWGNVTSPPAKTTTIGMQTFPPFPPFDDNSLLADTLCHVHLQLLFFREPIDPATFEFDIGNVGEDLRIQARNPCELDSHFSGELSTTVPWRSYWDYAFLNGKLKWLDMKVARLEIDSTSDEWRGNSKIASLQDLLGSQLIVQLGESGWADNDAQQLRKSIALANLIIRFQNGIVMNFDQDNLVLIAEDDQFRAYSFIFPDTMHELIKATSYDQFKKLEFLKNAE